ncbi:MAG: DUF4215 domain-containing protein, partial [Nannocystaceae bacterium]
TTTTTTTGDGDGDGDGDVCGDGMVTGNEECDNGANNGQNGDECKSDCTDNFCGDNYISSSEECDDGASNGNNISACKSDCTVTTCGDGYQGGLEECDDGNNTDGDGCDANCLSETQNCGEAQVVVEPTPPNVMLVLDKSGSMFTNNTLDANNNSVTRWEALWNVTNNVTSAYDGSINFGAQLFPSVNASNNFSNTSVPTCLTSSPPEELIAANNAVEVMGAIPGASITSGDPQADGATPAYRGLSSAYDHLNDPINDQTLPKYAIFITDGAANCNEALITDFVNETANTAAKFEKYAYVTNRFDTAVDNLVADALANDNITTYVVGIGIVDYDPGADACTMTSECSSIEPSLECCDGTTNVCVTDTCAPAKGTPQDVNAYDEMNQIAIAGGAPQGGTEKFYDGTDQAALDAAINQITGQIFSCTLTLDPEPFPIQVDLVTITVDGVAYDTPLASAADCATQDGWYWSNPYSEVTLCGSACDGLKQTGVLDADYGCPGGGG